MPNRSTIATTKRRRCLSPNLHNSRKNYFSKSPLFLEFKFLKNSNNNLHKFNKGTANRQTAVNSNPQQQATTISLALAATISSSRDTMGTSRKASYSPSNASTYYKPAPAEICYRSMRFLITDRPSDVTIYQFIEELKKHNCQNVVRVCEPTYRTEPLNKEHITVLDWEFPDGNPPPKEIRDKWIDLVKKRFAEDPGSCIAVHCVAGLGRAPVLVALALMEAGMKYEDAVELIRQHRRGAINQRQLTYLEKYKSAGQLKKRDNCCMM